MNVPIVLNAPNKVGSYVRIVEEIYSNDQNEQKPNFSSRIELQHV
jgi:hypothetical protein